MRTGSFTAAKCAKMQSLFHQRRVPRPAAMPTPIPLDQHCLLRIAGPDRTSFLQGQLTQDVAAANDRDTILAGWADAKGRLLALAHLFAWQDAHWLLLPRELGTGMQRRLAMYVLRAKVEISMAPLELLGLVAGRDAPALTGADPGLPAGCLRLRWLGDDRRAVLVGPGESLAAVRRDASPAPDGEAAWTLLDVRDGIPRVLPQTAGQFVPQMVNLDLLGGISFAKGCYVGQEIVARAHYRGRIKRRMYRLAWPGAAPAPGDPVYAADGAAGQVVIAAATGANAECLAVLRMELAAQPLFADEQRRRGLEPLALPYAIPSLEPPSQAG